MTCTLIEEVLEELDPLFGQKTLGMKLDPLQRKALVPHAHDFVLFGPGDDFELVDVELYPLDIGFGRPMSQRGRPMLAKRALADEVIAWLQRVSEPFGTEISNEDGVGHIRLPRQVPSSNGARGVGEVATGVAR